LIEFAKLGCALAEVLGLSGSDFLNEFESSRVDAVNRTLDSTPAVAAMVEWFDARGRKEVVLPVKELMAEVETFRYGAEAWPRSPKGFADALRRAAPSLRQVGIECRGLPKQGGVVRWVVREVSGFPRPESPGSPGSAVDATSLVSQDFRTCRTWSQPNLPEEMPL
jgi:hypothetical protein